MISGVRRTLAVSALISFTLLAAQTPSGKPASSKSPLPQAKPQEVFAPYWTSEPGWDTELQLKNNLAAAPLTVTPVLRLASGEEIPLDPVTIASNASVSVWVNEGLLKHAPSVLNQPGSFGSVVFRFASHHAMNLYATAVPSIQRQPISFAVRAHPVPDPRTTESTPTSLEGIWWQPRSGLKDVLVVSNSSARKLTSTLSIFDAGGKRWTEPLSLAPYQTQRISLDEILPKSGLSGSYGGISLDASAPASALTAFHFMYDEMSQFSTSLEVLRRDPDATIRQRTAKDGTQWIMRAPLLVLSTPDPALGLPAGTTLQPTIFLRNATAKLATANLVLSWRAASARGQVKLPQLQIAPFATQQLQIAAMQKQLGIPDDAHWASATLTTSGLPDDLLAVASSLDATGRFHLDTNFSGTVTGHFVGGEWRADSDHDRLISVTNSGQKPTNALLTLHYDNGEKSYEMQQAIQPGDQVLVNVAELIRNRIADRKGETLPADLTFGTYDVLDLSGGSGSLSVGSLALDKALGYQAAVPSPDCCGDYGDVLSPDSIEVDISGFQTVEGQARNQCTGQLDVLAGLTSWWSGNTGVAQVAKAKVTGVAPGYTTANASGVMPVCSGNTLYWEDINLTAPVTVQPTVMISGPTNIPMLQSGTQGTDSITVTATGTPGGGTYLWTAVSGESNITILNSTSQSAILQSVAVGSYTVQVKYTLNSQSATAVTVGKVQQPGSLGVISNETPQFYCSNLPGNYTTVDRQIQYQVLDTSSPPVPIPVTGMDLTETLNIGSNTCGSQSLNPTQNAKSGTNGYFPAADTLQMCSPVCLPANASGEPTGSCALNVAQTWNVNGFQVKSDTLTYTCPGPPTGAP